MTTLTWILVIYLFTVAITFPFIRTDVRKLKDDSNHGLFNIFNYRFLAKVITFIPILNLYYGFLAFLSWLAICIIRRKIRQIGKDVYKRTGDIKSKEDFDKLDKMFGKHNSLEDQNQD